MLSAPTIAMAGAPLVYFKKITIKDFIAHTGGAHAVYRICRSVKIEVKIDKKKTTH